MTATVPPDRPGEPSAEEYTLSILVMPAQENSLGVMHGGHLMSWMDMAAWVVAARVAAADQTVLFKAVTDCVWSAPLKAGEVCSVTATLLSIGRTSLRIGLRARAEDPVRNVTHDVCTATFTMVAVGRDGTAEPVRRD